MTATWNPTPAHARAVVAALAFTAGAVLARRPDLLVVGVPLVVVTVWSTLTRPRANLAVAHEIGHHTVREGQAIMRRTRLDDPSGDVEDVAVVFSVDPRVEQQPPAGSIVASLPDDGDNDLCVVIRPMRWGRHRIGPPLVVAASAWNGYRLIVNDWADAHELIALPQPSPFDAVAPAVHTPGLIGRSRSPRSGSGTEFASVRPFQPGDRLRRIHWPTSLRSDRLHVATTFADHDRHVILLVDAFEDVGESGGIDGRASSLDIELRAAAAIAEHFVQSGDRVALTTMGSRRLRRVPPGVGRRHLRHFLEVLATIEPSNTLADDGRVPHGLGSGALVVVVSPFLTEAAMRRLVAISNHGLDVVGIDCLPGDITDQPEDPYAEITWRIELLRRERRMHGVRAVGIPVVPWRGPGSLDVVLRALHRRSNTRAGGR